MAYTTIDNPGLFFNTVLYTGNGSTNAITGVGFQPDWVWIKNRNDSGGGGYGHRLYDVIRGVTKEIYSNNDGSENTVSTGLTAFGTDGFTLGSSSGVNNNASGADSYVAWNWLGANGTASNSDGGITSTVSANTTAGFSIVQYVGTSSDNTVGHGLGAIPKMIITKGTSASGHWSCYHNKLANGADSYIELNKNNAASNLSLSPDYWGTPSSTVFGVKGGYGNSINGRTYIAYCFAEIKGYSKFGSYTGNGNTDGTFVYTGFKVGWVMVKKSNGTEAWFMADSTRTPANANDDILEANDSAAEGNSTTLDLLSNGFKFRHANGNATGDSYIYMAFAENPFVTVGTKAAGTAR